MFECESAWSLYWRYVFKLKYWLALKLANISNLFCSYLTARGNISQNSSGVLVALLDQAQKLEPQSGPPVVILETSKKYDRNHLKYYCFYGER